MDTQPLGSIVPVFGNARAFSGPEACGCDALVGGNLYDSRVRASVLYKPSKRLEYAVGCKSHQGCDFVSGMGATDQMVSCH